jgi:hypothetical protein
MVSRSRAPVPHPRDTRRLVALTDLLKALKSPEELDQGLSALRTRLCAENARQRRSVLWSRAALATPCVLAAMEALLVLLQRASKPERTLPSIRGRPRSGLGKSSNIARRSIQGLPRLEPEARIDACD